MSKSSDQHGYFLYRFIISKDSVRELDRDRTTVIYSLVVDLAVRFKAVLDIIRGKIVSNEVSFIPMLTGFITSFLVGLFACTLMLNIVKKSKLIYFAIYCAVVAGLTIIFSW